MAFPISELLKIMVERNGTDLLLCVGQPPQIRLSGKLIALDYDPLTPDRSKELCYQIMNEKQQKQLEQEWEADRLGHPVPSQAARADSPPEVQSRFSKTSDNSL